MKDQEIAGISGSVSTGVAMLCRAASDRVPKGAPRISVCASGALGALVGVQANVFGKAPKTAQEHDEYNLFGCLLLARMCSSATDENGGMGTEVNFEPQKLAEAMEDFEKLTGRKLGVKFKQIWQDALDEESKAADGLKSQFGQFFPQ